MFPIFGKFLRKNSAIGRAEAVIAKNLRVVVEDRKKVFDRYDKKDLIQLLLEQDEIRQKTEGVWQK